MAERWMLRGTQFANCYCAWGCACQFNAPTTHGFQLTHAEVGNGSTDVAAGIELHLSGSHAHFATLHRNQDGVIR